MKIMVYEKPKNPVSDVVQLSYVLPLDHTLWNNILHTQTKNKLIVKGHPVNPGAMESLRLLTVSSSVTEYITDGSIFDFIEHAKMVCVVNSGTGFGSSEYVSSNFPDNEWLYCVCTYESGTAKIYKNGSTYHNNKKNKGEIYKFNFL